MIKKRTLALVTSGLLVAAAALPSAASAQGYEWDIGERGDRPSGMPCVDTSRSQVCFQTKGDKIWSRTRSGTAARCNKDFPEYTDVEFLAGTYDEERDHIFDYWSRVESTWNTPD